MMSYLDRGEKAVLFACVYLSCLVVSCVAMWWLVLVGGSPFESRPAVVINSDGVAQAAFRPGEVVGIRRFVCASQEVGAGFAPALTSDVNIRYPLPGSLMHIPRGCREYTYGFLLPALPPGTYSFASTIRFQTNLVGRDEHAAFPSVQLEILP